MKYGFLFPLLALAVSVAATVRRRKSSQSIDSRQDRRPAFARPLSVWSRESGSPCRVFFFVTESAITVSFGSLGIGFRRRG